MNNRIFIFLILALSVCSCGHPDNADEETVGTNERPPLQYTEKKLPVDQFVTWVADKDNKLIKDKTISDINYQLGYLPPEYLAYTELKGEEYGQEKFDAVKKHYLGMTYFKLRITVKNGNGEALKYELRSAQQYNDRISYLSFRMQKDIYLVQGKDTVYPDLYHFERVFDLAPYVDVMLAFENTKFKPENEFTINYADGLFNKGNIKYVYKNNQLIDLPKISGV